MTVRRNYVALLRTPEDARAELAARAREWRLRQNMTQAELAARSGLSVGAVKHFEKCGEIRLTGFLKIVMTLGRILETEDWLKIPDVPETLAVPLEKKPLRRRARRRSCD